MNSTVSPSCYFGMHCHGFAAARLTCPAYVDGRRRENSSFLKDYCYIHMPTFRIVWLLRNLRLVGKLCLHDDKNTTRSEM